MDAGFLEVKKEFVLLTYTVAIRVSEHTRAGVRKHSKKKIKYRFTFRQAGGKQTFRKRSLRKRSY